jgi:RNA polymerase sigma-70 factor (ECF subfamily)
MNAMANIDRSEFDALLVPQLERMRGYAIRITGSREAADELLNQTALRALCAWSQFQPGTNFGAWMFRILRNEFVSGCRRAVRAPQQFPDADELAQNLLAVMPTQDKQLFRADIARALKRLPVAWRHALIAICVHGLSYEEYARYIEAPVGVVKSRLWRARERLGELLA